MICNISRPKLWKKPCKLAFPLRHHARSVAGLYSATPVALPSSAVDLQALGLDNLLTNPGYRLVNWRNRHPAGSARIILRSRSVEGCLLLENASQICAPWARLLERS